MFHYLRYAINYEIHHFIRKHGRETVKLLIVEAGHIYRTGKVRGC